MASKVKEAQKHLHLAAEALHAAFGEGSHPHASRIMDAKNRVSEALSHVNTIAVDEPDEEEEVLPEVKTEKEKPDGRKH